MICVIQRVLVTDDVGHDVWLADRNALFIAPADDCTHEEWNVYGKEGTWSLSRLWKEVVPKAPVVNQLFLVWTNPDQTLHEVLQFIHRQQSEYKVSVSLLFVGPMSVDESLEEILSLSSEPNEERFVSTIWYLGNEDSTKRSISLEERLRLVSEFVCLLLKGDDRLIAALRLYPSNQSLPPFTAFGFRSWAPPVDGAEEIVRYASSFMVRKELADKSVLKNKDEIVCSNEVSSIFSKLHELNTPYETVAESPQNTFPQKLSQPPKNPFRKWICFPFREIAINKGKYQILNQRILISNYYLRLKKELQELGDEVRHNGQVIFEVTRKSCQNFICQNPTILRMITLLHAYFPAMRSRVIVQTRTPCQSASVPSLIDCEKKLVKDAMTEFEKSCIKLPAIGHDIVVAVMCLVLLLLSYIMFRMHFRWQVSLIPFSCAILLFVGFVCWAAYRARCITIYMADYFDQHYDKLRKAYSDKLEWVVNNTHMILQRQLMAEISSVGYRLQKNFEDLFAEWEKQPIGEGESRMGKLLSSMELEKEDIEMLQDQIRGSAGDLIEDVMRDAPPIAGKRKAQELKYRFAQNIANRARQRIVDHERVAGQVMNCISREDPPVMTRISSASLQDDKLYKVFILPELYPNWEDDLESQSRRMMLDTRFWRGPISAPVVLTVRSHLTLDEMKATLVVTEVK